MKTKLFQVFYDTNQLIDPFCEPINAIGIDVGEIYENTHILNAYEKGFHDADYYGVVSWRFNEKTGLFKTDIDNFINNNIADVFTFYSHNQVS